MTSASDLEQYVVAFVEDLKQVHIFKAVMQLQKFIFNLQEDIAPCKDMGADIKTIESWASILLRPEELGETITYNYLENRQAINAQIKKEETDWAAASYFDAGEDFADIAVSLIGPAPTEVVEIVDYSLEVDVHMINHLLAGFIYGMTTQNHLTEIEACYAGGAEMDQEIKKAVVDFKAGGWDNIVQGCLEILLVGFQIPQELNTCKSMGDDISAIESWATAFTNKSKLISTVTKHFLMHKKQVTADIAELKADYAAEEYFKAGEEVATLASILIGPIE